MTCRCPGHLGVCVVNIAYIIIQINSGKSATLRYRLARYVTHHRCIIHIIDRDCKRLRESTAVAVIGLNPNAVAALGLKIEYGIGPKLASGNRKGSIVCIATSGYQSVRVTGTHIRIRTRQIAHDRTSGQVLSYIGIVQANICRGRIFKKSGNIISDCKGWRACNIWMRLYTANEILIGRTIHEETAFLDIPSVKCPPWIRSCEH